MIREGVPLICGGEFAATTFIENAGSDDDKMPSLTLITIPACMPMSPVRAVPHNSPVTVLNDAQPGRFCTLKVIGSLFRSDAVGTNEYAVPAVTDDDGVPLIVGLAFAAVTVIEKAGKEAVETLSETVMAMPAYVLSSPDRGVPESCPVDVLNVAQPGLF